MARESMDILELLRKRGLNGDVDFLLEALGVVAQGLMEAEVTVKTGGSIRVAASATMRRFRLANDKSTAPAN